MEDLIINGWENGIGQSPVLGFAQMINVDPFTQPGALRISRRLDLSYTPTELISWFAQDTRLADVFAVDFDGTLYKYDFGSDSWSIITGYGTGDNGGQGLGIWKDYLFYIRGTRIDVYGPLSGAPSWTNDWDALDVGSPYDLVDARYHPVLSMTNGVLAIGNHNFVDTLEQTANTVFDPTDPTTWLYNDKDLELDNIYEITCLEQLSSDLAMGTIVGSNGDINMADTFFWDRFSNYFDSNKTIRFADNGVQMMKNSNNILFTIAGLGVPRLFQSFTAQAQEFKRFNNISIKPARKLTLFPDAIDQKDGEVLLGIGGGQGGSNDAVPLGVYSTRNGAYVLRNLVSTLEDGSNDSLRIGAIKTFRPERYMVAWEDSFTSSFGVDILGDNFYTDYTAYVDTALYTVGTEDDPKTFEKVQVTMTEPLNDGDGIKIYARKNLFDTFTLVATFDTPTYLGRSVFDTKVGQIGGFKTAQFRIQLTTDVDSEVSPELKEVKFS